jgi:hypothetical protein
MEWDDEHRILAVPMNPAFLAAMTDPLLKLCLFISCRKS